MKKVLVFVLIFITFALAEKSSVSVLVGGSYSNGMLLKGLDAATYNPALLASDRNYGNSINFFPISLGFYNDDVTQKDINDYFLTGEDTLIFTADDRIKIANMVEDGLHLKGFTRVNILGFTSGHKAYGIYLYDIVSSKIPDDFFELFKGIEYNKTYDVSSIEGEYMNMASLEYSFADKFNFRFLDGIAKEVTLGATVRYLYGFPLKSVKDFMGTDDKVRPAYLKIENVSGKLKIDDLDGENITDSASTYVGKLDVKVSEGGHGIGIDMGMQIQFNDHISAGISVANLFSGISWIRKNKIYRFHYQMNGLTPDEIEDFSEISIDEDTVFNSDDTHKADKFFSSLPAELRLGFLWEFDLGSNYLAWSSAYNQYFKSRYLAQKTPLGSTGIEWYNKNLDWLRLRTGISFGGEHDFNLGGGMSLVFSHYAFEVGLENKGLPGKESKGLVFAFGQKFYW